MGAREQYIGEKRKRALQNFFVFFEDIQKLNYVLRCIGSKNIEIGRLADLLEL